MGDAGPVHRMPGAEVVAAVDHHIGLGDQPREQRIVGAQPMRLDADVRIDAAHRLGRRFDLGHAHPRRVVDDLALEIGEIDLVVVDQRDAADPGRGEIEQHRRTEPAGTDHQRMARADARLAVDAELFEQDVARIAQQVLVFHALRGRSPG